MSNDHIDAILQAVSRDPQATVSARVVAETLIRLCNDVQRLTLRVAELESTHARRAA